MIDIKLITPDDLGEGIEYNPATKKFEPKVIFTDREATVPLYLNGIELLFRQLANSNRAMVMTGIKYNGTWWGDAPDDEPFVDPFAE